MKLVLLGEECRSTVIIVRSKYRAKYQDCPRLDKTSKYRYSRYSVRLSHDVQQHGVARIHRIIVRWDPCGDIVDNPPGDQVGSVNLRAKEPFVVVAMNCKIRVLRIANVHSTRSPKRGKASTHRVLTRDVVAWLETREMGVRRVLDTSNKPHTTAQKS